MCADFVSPCTYTEMRRSFSKGNIKPILCRNDIAFWCVSLSVDLPREIAHLRQHILNKNPVPRGGIVDQHVRDRSDELADLNDRMPLSSVFKKG